MMFDDFVDIAELLGLDHESSQFLDMSCDVRADETLDDIDELDTTVILLAGLFEQEPCANGQESLVHLAGWHRNGDVVSG